MHIIKSFVTKQIFLRFKSISCYNAFPMMDLRPSQKERELSVTEIFFSIQGETTLSGVPTTFIRLAGCNLRCRWCDTPYSFPRGPKHSIEMILETVERNGSPYVCVTGGEPLLQKGAFTLMKELCEKGYSVNLETGGGVSTAEVDPRVKIILDVKCPASGMTHKMVWDNLLRLRSHDEVKFVLENREDYIFAKEICEKYSLYGTVEEVLFSPVHGVLDPKDLTSWILEDRLPVRLNLQWHKYIWGASVRGV